MIKVDIAAREIQIMEKMTVVGGIYKALFRGTEVCSSWFALLHNDCECNVTMNPGVANLRTQVLRLFQKYAGRLNLRSIYLPIIS